MNAKQNYIYFAVHKHKTKKNGIVICGADPCR